MHRISGVDWTIREWLVTKERILGSVNKRQLYKGLDFKLCFQLYILPNFKNF